MSGESDEEDEQGGGLAAFPVPEVLIELCEKYENDKVDLIESGYKEYKENNLRLLYNDNYTQLVELIEVDKYKVIPKDSYKVEFNPEGVPVLFQITPETSDITDSE